MSFWQAVKDGFTEESGKQQPPTADTLAGTLATPGTTGDPGDLSDYASLDMVQASVDADTDHPVDNREPEPLRLLNGGLDFLGELGQDGIAFVLGNEHGEGHRLPMGKPPVIVVQTSRIGSDRIKCQTYTVSTEQQILRRDPARRYAVVVNYGPNPVYIGANTRGGFADPQHFTIPVSKADGTAPYTPITLETCDEVWATGSGGVLEVMEFTGVPDDN